MSTIDLDREAQARGYDNWNDLVNQKGINYANELKKDFKNS